MLPHGYDCRGVGSCWLCDHHPLNYHNNTTLNMLHATVSGYSFLLSSLFFYRREKLYFLYVIIVTYQDWGTWNYNSRSFICIFWSVAPVLGDEAWSQTCSHTFNIELKLEQVKGLAWVYCQQGEPIPGRMVNASRWFPVGSQPEFGDERKTWQTLIWCRHECG